MASLPRIWVKSGLCTSFGLGLHCLRSKSATWLATAWGACELHSFTKPRHTINFYIRFLLNDKAILSMFFIDYNFIPLLFNYFLRFLLNVSITINFVLQQKKEKTCIQKLKAEKGNLLHFLFFMIIYIMYANMYTNNILCYLTCKRL